MTYAFMLGALVIGLALGALAWEVLVTEPLRRRLITTRRLFQR